MTTPAKDMPTQKKEAAGAVELAQDRPVFLPPTDIYEREDAVLVVCDMPGVDDQHVDVMLEDDVLTLTGSQEAQEPARHELLYRGHWPGVFRRSFTLTTEVDRAKIKARIRHGVLEVVLPKAEAAQPKRIKVETD
ncbi:MAG TPA: Hsp20/alpha crystallin family protein [Kiritimatiellia bacterium]|nr:Hsp20/alpha crystallin family protein [Kiritimatiellia bacterium]HRZ11813.1 Hsp20/alpha crystallin family protein [Kiritimatiellia bacterium]HSA17381.1 Hsp20/alpha crystallin family protein [Kiritimatiellia bacterium]